MQSKKLMEQEAQIKGSSMLDDLLELDNEDFEKKLTMKREVPPKLADAPRVDLFDKVTKAKPPLPKTVAKRAEKMTEDGQTHPKNNVKFSLDRVNRSIFTSQDLTTPYSLENPDLDTTYTSFKDNLEVPTKLSQIHKRN